MIDCSFAVTFFIATANDGREVFSKTALTWTSYRIVLPASWGMACQSLQVINAPSQ